MSAGSDRFYGRVKLWSGLQALWLAVAWGFAAPLQAQITFEEVAAASGITGYHMAVGSVGGVAAADFDRDGDIDVFAPTGELLQDKLWRNNGDGSFSEIAASVGLASKRNHRAALWFDYNGDHRLDLLIGGDCRMDPLTDVECEQPENLHLYRQEVNGQFTDVTAGSGLQASWGGKGNAHRAGLVAGDIDNDGDLDLYVCDWNGRAWLYRNNADGSFSDITLASGMSDSHYEHHQPVMYDFNRDGWQDIYVAVDYRTPNFLWINQGDGTFVDMANVARVNNDMTDMGVALGDYDNDLDMDIYVTNITRASDHNVFYRNDSTENELKFAEIAEDIGVWQGYWGWGTTFLDADNDGWLDLAATNGKEVGQWLDDPSLFYLNQGGNPVTFADVSDAVGFNDTYIAASLIALDYDRDGDLDMLQTAQQGGSLQLLRNNPGSEAAANHYLVIKPRMQGSNYYAIGAEVQLTAGGQQMMRVIRTATSTLGQEPAEAFFGLGAADHADEIRIRWPDGEQTVLTDVAADQVITVNDSPAFAINTGLNDAWFNPATGGQGFFITVFPGISKIFFAWFTFDQQRPPGSVDAMLGGPGQRWLTAFGSYENNRAELDVELTAGGVFDAATPPVSQSPGGQVILEFSGCNSGTVSYDIAATDQQGVVPIQRIALDNIARCETAAQSD